LAIYQDFSYQKAAIERIKAGMDAPEMVELSRHYTAIPIQGIYEGLRRIPQKQRPATAIPNIQESISDGERSWQITAQSKLWMMIR